MLSMSKALTILLFEGLFGFCKITSSSARSMPAMNRPISQRQCPKEWAMSKVSTAMRTAVLVFANPIIKRKTTMEPLNSTAIDHSCGL